MDLLPYLTDPTFALVVLGPVASLAHIAIRKVGLEGSYWFNTGVNIALSAAVSFLPLLAAWVMNGLPEPNLFWQNALAAIVASQAAYAKLTKTIQDAAMA